MEQALAELLRWWSCAGLILATARRQDSLPPLLGHPHGLPFSGHTFRPLILRAPVTNEVTTFLPGLPVALPSEVAAATVVPVQAGATRLASLIALHADAAGAAAIDPVAAAAAGQLLAFLIQAPAQSESMAWTDPRVQSVIEIGRTLAATLDINELAATTYRLIEGIMAADEFFVTYYDPERHTLDYRYNVHDGIKYPAAVLPAGDTLAYAAIEAGRPVHYHLPPSADDDPLVARWGDRRVTRSLLIVPLFENETPVAAISAQSFQPYAYTAEDEQLLSIIGSYFVIAARNANRLATSHAASLTDDLTGLGNRRGLRQTLDACIDRHRQLDEPQSLILFDADGLKKINDTYGHLAGDRFLMTIAQQIKAHVRKKDGAFRQGGDEFAVCLSGVPLGRAAEVAEQIAAAVSQAPIEFADTVFAGRVSAGVAELRDKGPHAVDRWVSEADAAVYAAKNRRPGSVSVAGAGAQPPPATGSGTTGASAQRRSKP